MSKQKNMFISIHDLLIEDETLLRLLYYPPADFRLNRPDPLSDELENILDKNLGEIWDIRDHHILLSSKDDDLIKSELCRIYLYPGKIRGTGNYMVAKQEIVIDVFCHYSYIQADQRMMMITDRLSELLFNERVSGLGRVNYRNGYDFVAPKGYEAFRHIFEVTRLKKTYPKGVR